MLIYLASCHVCSLYSILVCLSFPVDIIDKADTIEYRMILPNHKIKPWNQFIKISDSKINFIRFLCNERKNIYFWWRMFHSYSWKRQRCHILDTTTKKQTCKFFRMPRKLHNLKCVVTIYEDTYVFSIGIAKPDVAVPI